MLTILASEADQLMNSNPYSSSQHFVPSPDIVTSIVLPTIVFCIGMVVAMLVGIHKCKQWELDKIVEMRRTRRVIQRITARLQEKNFRAIQKARNMRKRTAAVSVATSTYAPKRDPSAPPTYSRSARANSTTLVHPASGNSPPPTYEDSLLDQLYYECMPPKIRQKQQRK
ncbi:hypothetical protein M3Y94_00464800 [Aphelenchoides besseyi]|nr:hypothetical protein M3Y94_00464800 [Aphelenchoides besseyi]KAI6229179.1 hypothetical protein M3Y95_00504000 [Aphelenchoides besseyi]